jgi:SAM-dependent methyltransferase
LDYHEVFGTAALAHFTESMVELVLLACEHEGPEGFLAYEPMALYFPGNDVYEPEYGLLLDYLAQHLPTPLRILDVGCGPGRFLARFAVGSHEVVGVDRSSEVVAIARQLVPVTVHCLDIWDVTPQTLGMFDLIVLFGHNLGIAGTPEKVCRLLERLRTLVRPGGWLAVNSLDKQQLDDKTVHTQVQQAQAQGRYPGQVRCRLRYGKECSQWFDWLHVAYDDLTVWAVPLGWQPVVMFPRPDAPAFWSALFQVQNSFVGDDR